jgi:preprotein translocase subunit SecG
METFVYALHIIVCLVLIAVVLLQRGKGADLGASLGGGSANTIFGSRGAGNFLTKITTASAITFMATSLTLSYLGYQSSDIRLFDGNEPIEIPVDGATPEAGALEEIPSANDAAAGDAANDSGGNSGGHSSGQAEGGLVEIPSSADAVAVETPESE